MTDIIERLNKISLQANWGSVEREDGIPESVAVIRDAITEIKTLRKALQLAGKYCDAHATELCPPQKTIPDDCSQGDIRKLCPKCWASYFKEMAEWGGDNV